METTTTTTWLTAAQAVLRFEAIRRLLGHATALGEDARAQLNGLTGRELVQRYATLADAAWEEHADALASAFPEVRPAEDGRDGGVIEHVTCSGVTTLRVDVDGEQGMLGMDRREAIHPDDGFRASLAILTGYLHRADGRLDTWETRDGSRMPKVFDPRVSARDALVKALGERAAGELIDAYTPHWGAWRVEQRVSEAETRIGEMRREQEELTRRRRPARQAVSPPAEEPVADWERELLNNPQP